MAKKKDFVDPFKLKGWDEEDKNDNYELKYLRLENQKLREQIEHQGKNKKIDVNMEKDIAALLDVSMKMKYLLEQCRSNMMLPIELGRQIDNVIKEIENY